MESVYLTFETFADLLPRQFQTISFERAREFLELFEVWKVL